MDRRTLRSAVVALLVVLAVGFAAATLTSTLQSGSGLGGGGGAAPAGGNGTDTGGAANLSDDLPDDLADRTSTLCFPVVNTVEFRLGVFALWAGIGGVLFWRVRSRYVAGGVWLGVTLMIGGLYSVFAGLCGRDIQEEVVRNVSQLQRGTGGVGENIRRVGGEAGSLVSSSPVLTALIVVVGVALLVGLAVLYSRETLGLGGGSATDATEEAYEEEYDAAALRMMGEAAGEAADNIEAGDDADNEVYRAWREMTGYVDVDRPAASTPREFADAAVAAGMDGEDVAALTAVFEEVRYGGLPATEDAVERATTALRNIEAAYAETEETG